MMGGLVTMGEEPVAMAVVAELGLAVAEEVMGVVVAVVPSSPPLRDEDAPLRALSAL